MTDQNKITKVTKKVKAAFLPTLKAIMLSPYAWLLGMYLALDTSFHLKPGFTLPALALSSLFLGLGLSKVEFGMKYQDYYTRRKKKSLARIYSKTKWNGFLLFICSLAVISSVVYRILDLDYFTKQSSFFAVMFALALSGFATHTLLNSEYTKTHRFFWGVLPLVFMGAWIKFLLPGILASFN